MQILFQSVGTRNDIRYTKDNRHITIYIVKYIHYHFDFNGSLARIISLKKSNF